ncbi:hypothetical protein LTS15_005345 [Exophiala xenobiotica]|nr:hypothetical protein LTS15_005345 [Exophiala xenobiotica]
MLADMLSNINLFNVVNHDQFFRNMERLIEHVTNEQQSINYLEPMMLSKIEGLIQQARGKNVANHCNWALSDVLSRWVKDKSTFLTIAIFYGHYEYVKPRLSRQLVNERVGRPFLDYVLSWQPILFNQDMSQHLRILRLILDLGGDPNEVYEGRTIWSWFLHLALAKIQSAASMLYIEFCAEAIRLLLQRGASKFLPRHDFMKSKASSRDRMPVKT